MPVANLKHIKLYYESYGDTSLPAVLLVMGLGTPSAVWPSAFISMLIERGLRVITVDNRDCGLSEKFPEAVIPYSVPMAIGRALLRLPVSAPYKLEDMALDLDSLLNYLSLKKVHVVGASLGGMIAQVLATIRPSKVQSLTSIMSASGNPRTGFGKLKAIYTLMMQPNGDIHSEESRAKHYDKIFSILKSPGYQYPEDIAGEMLSSLARYEFDAKASERQLLAILASGDRSSQLSRLKTPTLVIHGEDDPLLPLAAGKEVADLIPNSKIVVLPQMGHDFPPIHFETIASLVASHVWEVEA